MYQLSGFPKKGSLVIGTVKKISEPTVTLSLEEYKDKEGSLHTTEIERSWVRKLKSRLKPGTKVVCLVMYINEMKNQIDLSQRRVGTGQNRMKLQEWNNEKTADSILTFFAKENKTPSAYNKIKEEILGKYGSLYPAFIRIASGEKDIIDDNKINQELIDFVSKRLAIPKKQIAANMKLSFASGNGLTHLKKCFNFIKEAANKIDVKILYLGAPKYKVTLTATDYKVLEASYSKMSKDIEDYSRKNYGTAEFTRKNV